MDIAELRAQLEEDLAWRLDELRLLRNALLGDVSESNWPAHAMRAILVMQYAHLEGLTQNSFYLYVEAINARRLAAKELHANLLATSLANEFKGLRAGAEQGDENGGDGAVLRRAKRNVRFVERIRNADDRPLRVDPERAITMEMNLGADVLRKTLFMVGIPESTMSDGYLGSLEFVRRTRNNVGHGVRTGAIPPRLFNAHMRKCEEFMSHIVRVITTAVVGEWFKANVEGAGRLG